MTTTTATSRGLDDPVSEEQRVLDDLYDLLDAETQWIAAALRRAANADVGATPSAILDRDALVNDHRLRLAQLQAAVEKLCFGRIDRTDGTSWHLGRVGLARPDGGARALLDWRAPAAAAFYQATGASPMGLRRRRHLQTRGRRVTGVDDELLEVMTASPDGDDTGDSALDTNSALLAALNAPRDGRMHEVVATIQAEQDRIIRAPLSGVLVVQGAPGTGKTVVALHRAAYLLYTYRHQLTSGVLVIGPGEAFLGYIRQVLPSLGETGATLASLAGLHAGVGVTAPEEPAVAALKGDLRMAEVIRRAVEALPRVPDAPVPLDVDGDRVVLRPADVAAAVRRARAEDLTHNVARVTFVREILERLVRGLGRATGHAPEEIAGATRIDLLRALHASRDVRREVNRCWPLTTPERLLGRLYRDPDRLAAAAPQLNRDERDLLRRADPVWTPGDVALLDEAAELLGEDPEPARRRAAARAAAQADEVRYAQGVTQLLGSGAILDGQALAARYAGGDGPGEVEDSGPRVYGHVVVDEAQELTAMQWRAVLRRCPSRSMTLVGDIAQGTSPGAAASWRAALEPHLGDRWSVAELTVNYRLPRQINELAHAVLAATGAGVGSSQARAVRDVAGSVRVYPAPVADAIQTEIVRVTRQVAERALDNGSGTLAVLATQSRVASLAASLTGWPGRLSVLTTVQAKGLEFDIVIVLLPQELLNEVGARGLYVALTRATQQLHVIGDLPGGTDATG